MLYKNREAKKSILKNHFHGTTVAIVSTLVYQVRTWAGRAYTDDELSRRFENQSAGEVEFFFGRRMTGWWFQIFFIFHPYLGK